MADARYTIVGGGAGGGILAPSAAPSFTAFALNATTDQLEIIFQAEDNVTITKVGVRVGTITGTTPTYRVSLQGVDGSGNPDGVIKGGGSPASKTFSPSGLGWSNATFNWITLDNAYACGAGEFLALVIDYSSGTVDGSNNATFASGMNSPTMRFPYSIQNDAGSRARQTAGCPVFGYGTTTRVYGNPGQTLNTRTFTSTTGTFDEWGALFSLPAGWGDTYQLLGVRATIGLTAASTFILGLYGGTDTTAANSTGAATEVTAHQNVTYDQDVISSTNAGPTTIWFDESTLATLYYGATYRVSFQPQAAVNFTLQTTTVSAAADQDAFSLGQSMVVTKRLNAGNWTDDTTERAYIELILADITEPAAAGGGALLRPVNMAGGFV